jgi:competence protein ComEC
MPLHCRCPRLLVARARRRGVALFLVLVIAAFAVTRSSLLRWEARVPHEARRFSGVILDPGIARPGDPNGARYQKIRLSEGVTVMLWMRIPGRRGDAVTGVASFHVGDEARNPGGFSERLWLWSEGAAWTGRPVGVKLTARDAFARSLRRAPDRFRAYIRQHLAPFWQADGGAIAMSLTLGDTRGLSERERFLLRDAGLAHLTSVSGTHLYFLIRPIERWARRGRWSRRTAQRLTVAAALLLCVLCGWKVGVARATLMMLACQIDVRARRRRDPLNTLCFVASVLLIASPYAVFSRGFWMSLTAAAAMSTVPRAPTRDGVPASAIRRVTKAFLHAMGLSFIAQAAILPYLWGMSPGISLWTPCVNALALPVASAVTAIDYALMAILAVCPSSVGGWVGARIHFAARMLTRMAEAASGAPGAFVPVPVVVVAVMAAAVAAARIRLGHDRRRTMIAVSGLIAAILLVGGRLGATGPTRVVFLDVGQGDATLALTASGGTVLIDGGDPGHGYRTVLPTARFYGRSTIDLAVVTHGHRDHAGGILDLLSVGRVGALALPDVTAVAEEDDLTAALRAEAAARDVPVVKLSAGESVTGDGWTCDVLHPERGMAVDDLNMGSLVTRWSFDGCTILLTGDVTEAGERVLLTREVAPVDCLHVAHHGAQRSTSTPFLEAASPAVAIVSVGRDNRYGHPHPATLERLGDRGIEVHRTDRSGAVFLIIREGKGTIKPWLSPSSARPERGR